MKDKILSGYVYSYLMDDGKERLIISSFGTTKSKLKRYFNRQNGLIGLKTLTRHKRYAVQIKVVAEAPIERNET